MRFRDRQTHVTAIIPCLDEEGAIGPVVRDVLAQGVDEVLVVDGGSRDETAACAQAAGARVVIEPRRGYGRAMMSGIAATRPETAILLFMDGDGSDRPQFIPDLVRPVTQGEADFVHGTRVRGDCEAGSLSPQQRVAGALAGFLLHRTYGVRFTDMSPFRAIRRDTLQRLGMREDTFGWNLEMQMRVAASGLRVLEVSVGQRRRMGGTSKVSGNLKASVRAAFVIGTTFLRLQRSLRRPATCVPESSR